MTCMQQGGQLAPWLSPLLHCFREERSKTMLIPILWTAIVCMFTGVAVHYNCEGASDEVAVLFTMFVAIGFSFAALVLCLVAGM